MPSSVFKNYEKVNYIAEYIVIFFAVLAFVATLIQPEPSMTGFWISLAIATLAGIVAIYNDVQHKKYDKLKKRALGGLGVILLTAVYFIFFFDIPL